MNDDVKRQFDAIATLWKARWDNFNQRRIYEWKFSLAVWTVFLVYLGKYIFNSGWAVDLPSGLPTGVALLGGVVVFAHLLWLYGLGAKNLRDKRIMIAYERELQNIINATGWLPPEVLRQPVLTRPFLNISHAPQALVTLVLYTASLLTSSIPWYVAFVFGLILVPVVILLFLNRCGSWLQSVGFLDL